ncbi:MAG: hypothetical protein DRI98_10565 [Bacteroidetes bacterium]|nr:MAG: hypothetical protein DRI98_10565 [Bacteroidota bacterium]
MAGFPDRMSQFWKELKDRNVIRSTTVYVAVVFGLLELIDIISGPLHLPGWVLTVFIFLFIAGFPIIILVSWIFCFAPEGIKRYKTQPTEIGSVSTDELIPVDTVIRKCIEPEAQAKHTGRIYGISSFVVICLVIIFFLFYSGKSAPFEERDWVVLADFVNLTEEDIFNKSLSTAFEISINQSRHINVISRQRVQEVLNRIGEDKATPLDEKLCREIAIREGAKVYILPEISRVGHQYILTGKVQETATGRVVVSEIIYSDNQDEILMKLDRLTKKIRRHLGESRYKISGQSKLLAKVTTSSLDALKQYSLGIEYHLNLDFSNAVTHYENAIRLDSTFTAAKASLGNILYERFDKEKGKYWLDEAMLTVDNLTEREKLGIQAFYAAKIGQDLDLSLQYTRMNIELYPDDAALRNNLGWYLQNQQKYQEAAEAYKEAIRIDPYAMLPYGGLIWMFSQYLGNADSVIIWSERMISHGPDNGWGYFYLGSGYFTVDDLPKADASFEKARELTPGLTLNLYRLANTKRVLGRYESAIEVLKTIAKLNPQEAPAYYQLGINYQLMGEQEMAETNYRKFKSFTEQWELEMPDNPVTYLSRGVVLSRLGEMEEGLEVGAGGFEMDTSDHFNYARLLAVQEKKDQAMEQIEMALKSGYRDLCWLKMDPDLSTLQGELRFKQLLNQYFK